MDLNMKPVSFGFIEWFVQTRKRLTMCVLLSILYIAGPFFVAFAIYYGVEGLIKELEWMSLFLFFFITLYFQITKTCEAYSRLVSYYREYDLFAFNVWAKYFKEIIWFLLVPSIAMAFVPVSHYFYENSPYFNKNSFLGQPLMFFISLGFLIICIIHAILLHRLNIRLKSNKDFLES
ncbi:hypothetical protein MHSWG343_10280 [Candidatus Mycoplasma haematohominis]|uniref:Uncharacterized protein n=1 Tax=Candidatus Mycoplasma haematohominis TaxID=1494318 RepID=A0A478FVH0_9MOLU|nr:hypothetical protein MHSWG343_10280 [Candidatus Mycoplasma haemohominis]